MRKSWDTCYAVLKRASLLSPHFGMGPEGTSTLRNSHDIPLSSVLHKPTMIEPDCTD